MTRSCCESFRGHGSVCICIQETVLQEANIPENIVILVH